MLIECIREMEKTLLEAIECVIARLLDNHLAIGVLLGIIVNVVAIAFVGWCRRPVLKSPQNDEDWLRDFGITVNDYRGTRVTGKQKVSVWRLKIRNSGRSVADNVRATVLPVFADGSGVERRIAWYEEPRNRLTLNRGDHSYLDVYGVLQGEAKEICFPHENGWGGIVSGVDLSKRRLQNLSVRVTGANCKAQRIHINLDENGIPKKHS